MRGSSQVTPTSYLKANAAEVLVLLKFLALGDLELAAGKVKPVAEVAARLRAKPPGV